MYFVQFLMHFRVARDGFPAVRDVFRAVLMHFRAVRDVFRAVVDAFSCSS